jgi:hypothetical protein
LTLSNLETYKNSEKFSQLGVSEQGIIEGLISLI